jgi:hypothetical protein
MMLQRNLLYTAVIPRQKARGAGRHKTISAWRFGRADTRHRYTALKHRLHESSSTVTIKEEEPMRLEEWEVTIQKMIDECNQEQMGDEQCLDGMAF